MLTQLRRPAILNKPAIPTTPHTPTVRPKAAHHAGRTIPTTLHHRAIVFLCILSILAIELIVILALLKP
jgi:hypothetical protein